MKDILTIITLASLSLTIIFTILTTINMRKINKNLRKQWEGYEKTK